MKEAAMANVNCNGNPPISVLVVDDEPILCELSGILLSDRGFRVAMATSFAGAISILQNSPIDVVVTDVQMPNGTGIDLLREINKMEGFRPLVFLVSAFTKLSLEDSHRLGAVDLLDKPIDFDELVQKIMSAREGTICDSFLEP
jgi:two-component system response regulator PilR (NtrC family)